MSTSQKAATLFESISITAKVYVSEVIGTTISLVVSWLQAMWFFQREHYQVFVFSLF